MTRILVIDDDHVIRHVVAEVLTDEGFEVVTAESGESGLRSLAECLPDTIVLDLMMPSMDGRAFRRNMPPEFWTVPILIVSGSRDIHDAAEEIGAAGALPKPFDLDDLVAAVRRTVALS